MKHLHLDVEAYSEADITKVGAYIYASHPSTEALMLGWKPDPGIIHMWDIHGGEPMPQRLQIALNNPEVLCHSFNANFDRLILKFDLGIDIPIERWRCSMCRAYSYAFTGSLDKVLSQCLPHLSKDPEGDKLIRRFSKPQPKNHKVSRWTKGNDPEGYEKFKKYCERDVDVEYQLTQYLDTLPYLEVENRYYATDQRINDRGVPIDPVLIGAAQTLNTLEKGIIKDELRMITGLDNPNSNDQLIGWLRDQWFPMPNMQAETVRRKIERLKGMQQENPEFPEFPEVVEQVLRVLTLKQQLAKTSVAKWNAFGRCKGEDDRVRGMFQFAGASRTNRWAGRLVQLQNLARGGNTTKDPVTLADYMALDPELIKPLYSEPMMALSDCIRCAITAPEGKLFNVADLSSIESRVLGWVADCTNINTIFRDGLDTYKMFGSMLFNIPYDQVTKEQRNYSKPPVLGCGYMLGKTGLIGYADGMGVDMTEEESERAVFTFRNELAPEIPKFWKWCEHATFRTAQTGATVKGPHGLRTQMIGDFMFLWLPSGRHIAYHQPSVLDHETPWGEVRPTLSFMGINRDNYQWERVFVHPGFITENIVQAIARDILCIWMDRAERAGFTMVLSAHDEIAAEEDRDRVEELCELIREPIPWAPGLLLDAEGFTTKRYIKG